MSATQSLHVGLLEEDRIWEGDQKSVDRNSKLDSYYDNNKATGTIENSLSVESIRKGDPWIVFDDYPKHYTKVIATLGRECREWAEGETNEAVEDIIAEICNPGDALIDPSRKV